MPWAANSAVFVSYEAETVSELLVVPLRESDIPSITSVIVFVDLLICTPSTVNTALALATFSIDAL